MEFFGTGSFSAVVVFGCLDTLFEGSKVHLVQLECKLVDVKLINLSDGEGNLDLDRDDFAESLSFGPSEGQIDGVDLVHVSIEPREDGQWDADLEVGLALDWLFDGNVENFNWEFVECLLVSEGEGAVGLPRPVGIVENLDLFDEGSAW